MSERALTITRRAALNLYTYLDLGRCDLSDFDFIADGWLFKAILLCGGTLETLILSNSWIRFENSAISSDSSNYIESNNKGERNYFRIIPSAITMLSGLTTLICAGDGYKGFEITDISLLEETEKLEVLDLSNNKISDTTGLAKLKKLRRLDLRQNQITDIIPLIPLLMRPKSPLQIVLKSSAVLKDGEINLSGNPLPDEVRKVIGGGTEYILEHFGFAHIKRAKMTNNTIRIFLASSEQLKSSRQEFEIFIYRETKRLQEKNIFLILEKWEDSYQGMSATKK